MQSILLVGRTGKFVSVKEVEGGMVQYIFTVFCNNGKDKDSTDYRCILRGKKESVTKLAEHLFIVKGISTNSQGKEQKEYHSRLVSINGTLSVSKRAQMLPVVGLEGEFEEVLAMDITVFVNSIEFHDANPGKKDASGVESKQDISGDERAKRREELKRKKEQANASSDLSFEDEESVLGQTLED
ncbi:MAG: hypothetical protein ACRCX2_23075 [Paraclostridium sp.]